jgi:ATP-binding cassette subfamily B (MDR/TAP) protein 1
MNLLPLSLQAGKLLQLASAFFGGFVIAFTRGWLLTLVMLTSLPLIAIAGAVSAQFLTRVSSKKLTSYGDAGDTVEQTIGAIRTVRLNYVNYFTVYRLLCK